MKSKLLSLLLAGLFTGVSSISLAGASTRNQQFSGDYKIISCSPDCDQIKTSGFHGNWVFSDFKGIYISVVDKPWHFWDSCSDSTPTFEFNLWPVGPETPTLGIPFLHTNIAQVSNDWQKVCDGVFTVMSSSVSLDSSDVSIQLVHKSGQDFELKWRDDRKGNEFSGLFKLEKQEF